MENQEAGKYILKITLKKQRLCRGIIYKENGEKVDRTSMNMNSFKEELIKRLSKKEIEAVSF
jgi:hypothetical protein